MSFSWPFVLSFLTLALFVQGRGHFPLELPRADAELRPLDAVGDESHTALVSSPLKAGRNVEATAATGGRMHSQIYGLFTNIKRHVSDREVSASRGKVVVYKSTGLVQQPQVGTAKTSHGLNDGASIGNLTRAAPAVDKSDQPKIGDEQPSRSAWIISSSTVKGRIGSGFGLVSSWMISPAAVKPQFGSGFGFGIISRSASKSKLMNMFGEPASASIFGLVHQLRIRTSAVFMLMVASALWWRVRASSAQRKTKKPDVEYDEEDFI